MERKRKLAACLIATVAIVSLTIILLSAEEELGTAPSPPFQSELMAMQALLIAAVQVREEKRFRADTAFWELYHHGDDKDWYQDYRMKRLTFNQIVEDYMPFLYDLDDEWATEARQVKMATIVSSYFGRGH